MQVPMVLRHGSSILSIFRRDSKTHAFSFESSMVFGDSDCCSVRGGVVFVTHILHKTQRTLFTDIEGLQMKI